MKSTHKSLLLVPLLVLLSSCGAPKALTDAIKGDTAKVWIEKLVFDVKEGVNNNAPVAVHLVVAYTDEVNGKLAKLAADKYFEDQKQMEKDYKDAVDFFKFEITPGQRMPDQNVTLSHTNGLGGYIFARYSSPGPHRASISSDRVVKIILGKIDFEIQTVKE